MLTFLSLRLIPNHNIESKVTDCTITIEKSRKCDSSIEFLSYIERVVIATTENLMNLGLVYQDSDALHFGETISSASALLFIWSITKL